MNRAPLNNSKILELRQKFVGPSCELFFKSDPLRIVSAKGQYMYGENGKCYLDCINNVAHVGHCHPAVVDAGSRQMALLSTNSRFLHDNLSLLAEKLSSIFPGDLSVCYFVNSGSEANDLALRLARAYTGHNDAIVLDHAYHGITTAVTDLSPYKYHAFGKQPRPDWVHVVPNPDTYRGKYTDQNTAGGPEALGQKYADEIREALQARKDQGRSVAMFLAESLQSCGGQIIPPPGYLAKAFKYVREAGGVCVADEVQVGFGRVGRHWWAFEEQGVIPDIVTLGKPMGNGHPVSAVITTPQIAKSFGADGMEYFSTFGGNPVSCGIALAVLDTIEKEDLRGNAVKVGDHLLQKLKELQGRHPAIGDVRGRGLFIGIDMVANRETREPDPKLASRLLYRLKEEGILLSADGPYSNVLKFKSPMCFSIENANELLSKLDLALSERIQDGGDHMVAAASKTDQLYAPKRHELEENLDKQPAAKLPRLNNSAISTHKSLL